MPCELRYHIEKLDISVSLGGEYNDRELKFLIGVIRATTWSAVPNHWHSRSRRRKKLSPGRTVNAGDWIFYEPWNRVPISQELAKAARREPRTDPMRMRAADVERNVPEGPRWLFGTPEVSIPMASLSRAPRANVPESQGLVDTSGAGRIPRSKTHLLLALPTPESGGATTSVQGVRSSAHAGPATRLPRSASKEKQAAREFLIEAGLLSARTMSFSELKRLSKAAVAQFRQASGGQGQPATRKRRHLG